MNVFTAIKTLIWLFPWSIMARMAVHKSEIYIWPHLGLGDTISMAMPLEKLSQNYEKVYVACREQNYVQLTSLFSYLENVEFQSLQARGHSAEPWQVLMSARRVGLWPTVGGHGLFFLLWFSGQISKDFNGVLAYCLGWSGPLISTRLKNHLRSITDINRIKTPKSFAFVDHHPGTWREIPSARLHEIRNRLEVRFNAQEIPFLELLDLMFFARELHLVPSAPLCLALTADLNPAGIRIAYLKPGHAPIEKDYDQTWQIDLLTSTTTQPQKVMHRWELFWKLTIRLLLHMFPLTSNQRTSL